MAEKGLLLLHVMRLVDVRDEMKRARIKPAGRYPSIAEHALILVFFHHDAIGECHSLPA
jgi:hypothetical protein